MVSAIAIITIGNSQYPPVLCVCVCERDTVCVCGVCVCMCVYVCVWCVCGCGEHLLTLCTPHTHISLADNKFF